MKMTAMPARKHRMPRGTKVTLTRAPFRPRRQLPASAKPRLDLDLEPEAPARVAEKPQQSGPKHARIPIKRVSVKRTKENRVRRAMRDRRWPGGEIPKCVVPWCPLPADDLHEPLTRARGGSITDEANTVPMCRGHNDDLAHRPESELGWAYDLGLLVHSWSKGDAA